MALRCRSGLPAPFATLAIICRASGELLCASTKSARSFSRGDVRALEDLLEHRHRLLGIGVLQALEREQLQFLVALGLRTNRLTDALPHLQFERLRIGTQRLDG